MSLMKILMWVIGVPIALAIIYIVYVFINMIFITQITDIKKSFDTDYEIKADDIEIEEISDRESILEIEFKPGTGDLEGSKDMVLTTDGNVEDRIRYFDDDPGRQLDVLVRADKLKPLLFDGNDVFEVDEGRLGEKIGSYSGPKIKYVRHVLPVDQNTVLVNGDREEATYADPWLFQMDLNTFDKVILTKEPYTAHSRPPKIFVNKQYETKVVIYYVGSYGYGFGNQSRPKKSIIRIYNKKFPKGKDLASFAFKAGTIVDVEWDGASLVLTGDPSKPTGNKKDRLPARKWKLSFVGNEV